MLGQGRDRLRDIVADRLKQSLDLVVAQLVGDGVIGLRLDPLPHHHLHPAVLGEQFLIFAEDAAGFAEQLDLLLQAVGDLHLRAPRP